MGLEGVGKIGDCNTNLQVTIAVILEVMVVSVKLAAEKIDSKDI